MKYLFPVILLLAVAGASSAQAELMNYGPYLHDQMEQAKQAAIYERQLREEQKTQADQSAIYEKELGKDQKAQADQSATYATALGKEQKDQAEKSAAYTTELGKEQKDQAEKSAAYAKELAAHDTEWRNARYKLRSEQEHEMDAVGGKMFDESRLGAPAAKPAKPGTPGDETSKPAMDKAAAAPDNKAADDKKPDLLNALKEIDEGR